MVRATRHNMDFHVYSNGTEMTAGDILDGLENRITGTSLIWRVGLADSN